MTTRRNLQRGIAAIEFALVFMVLFFLLYSIATFGAALYIQQVISRAAEDGARAAPFRPQLMVPAEQTGAIEEIKDLVRDSLAQSLIVPQQYNTTVASRRAWIIDAVAVDVTPPNAAATLTVTVAYPYNENRILPSLPLMDASRWMPETLRGHATVVLGV